MSAIMRADLTTRFGDRIATNDLSFTVKSGENFGFLGSKGTGPSTTANSLPDFARPRSGRRSVFGTDACEKSRVVRQRVGILRNGGLIASDAVNGLRDVEHGNAGCLFTEPRLDDDLLADVESSPNVLSANARAVDDEATLAGEIKDSKLTVLSEIEDAGLVVEDFPIERASLEDIFYADTTETAEVIA